jgi:hypothetical protein
LAKVSAAKQKITEFLKAKGLDASEIQDAFAELDAADQDLGKLADALNKNNEWVNWYQQVNPALQEIITERDGLKERIRKLEAAGLSFEDAKQVARDSMQQAPQSNFDPNKFTSDITSATNTVMKDVARYGFKHFKTFNEELDYDAVEKLMAEKRVPFDVAYSLYVEPRMEEKRKQEMTEKIAQGIKEGMQAELSKQGIRKTRKRTDDVDPAPLDKPAPSDSDLKEAFLRDLDTEVTH